jgi:hypothetical protein
MLSTAPANSILAVEPHESCVVTPQPRITLGVYAHVIGDQQRDAVENRSARIEKFAVNWFNWC